MHHAYLVVGDREASLLMLEDAYRVPGADVIHYEPIRFGIDEARRLKHESTLMPVTGNLRTFVLSITSITLEAQNALLKLFEEPVSTAQFYILARSEELFIPTLRSRFSILRATPPQGSKQDVLKSFLQSSYSDRLIEIAARTKDKDGDWIEALLDDLEVWAAGTQNETALREIVFVRTYARAPSASLKMLLEHLALSLPIESARK